MADREQCVYIIAEVRADGCLAGTVRPYDLFTDRDTAFAELKDARDSGLINLGVYQLQPCREPRATLPPGRGL